MSQEEEPLTSGYKFAKIPEWVLYHRELSPTDKMVYATLDRFAGPKGCYPGLLTLAERTGVSEQTIRRSLVALADAKAITIVPRFKEGRQTTNQYALAGDSPLSRLVPRPVMDGTPGGTTGDTQEREKEERKKTCSSDDERPFDSFWEHWPRKVAKFDAQKAWKTLSQVDRQLAINFVSNYKRKLEELGKFCPLPATWLRGQRWTDDPALLLYGPERSKANTGPRMR